MIYLIDHDMAILHVPRTGGTSLRLSLEGSRGVVIHCGTAPEEHMTAAQARDLHPGCRTLAVVRSPWEIFASMWKMGRLLAARESITDWIERLMSWMGCVSFSAFVRHAVRVDQFNVAAVGGFAALFCDHDTEILRYHSHINDEIVQRFDLYRCSRDHRINHTRRVPPPAWAPDTVNAVWEYCRNDIALCGWLPPVHDALNRG